MSVTELLTEVSQILTNTGVFSSVIIREDTTAVIGREPAAYIEYGGMTEKDDNGVTTEAHTVNVFVRLLSIGRADMTPLDKAFKAIRASNAVNVKSVLDSTDKRTVTFKISAEYLTVTA